MPLKNDVFITEIVTRSAQACLAIHNPDPLKQEARFLSPAGGCFTQMLLYRGLHEFRLEFFEYSSC